MASNTDVDRPLEATTSIALIATFVLGALVGLAPTNALLLVEPSKDIPAKSPREREYVRISARKVTSVAA